jgi:transcriptional regulator with XRE-family HTH domain
MTISCQKGGHKPDNFVACASLCALLRRCGLSILKESRDSINFVRMNGQQLDNYLRNHRRRSGLSQREVAAVMGCRDGGVVSRHERSRHLPPLRHAIAYEVLFQVPICEMFAGLRQGIEKVVEAELRRLESELQRKSGKGSHAPLTARKLVWIAERRDFQHVA